MADKLARGTQVIYVPWHAKMGDPLVFEYPNNAQPGFITSGPDASGNAYFVRYWRLDKEGKVINDLRTKANPELTPAERLIVKDTVPQADVERALEEWC